MEDILCWPPLLMPLFQFVTTDKWWPLKAKALPILTCNMTKASDQIKEFKGKKIVRPSGGLEDVLKGQTPPPPLYAIVRNFQTPSPLLLRTS